MAQYKILFDNPQKTYFPGQKVTGKIEIYLEEPEQTTGILLSIIGKGRMEWKKIHLLKGCATYSDEEEYLKIEHYCAGGEDHDIFTMPPGINSYPFSLDLPFSLPSSSECKFGRVRYVAKVTFERIGKPNQEIKTAFTVVSPYDLNKFPDLLMPERASKEYYQCCCTSWFVTATLMVEKTGYVCGNIIPVIIEIQNCLRQDILRTTLILQQISTCLSRASNATKTNRVILEQTQLGQILRYSTKIISLPMSIPPVPPSTQESSPILKIEYQICLEITHGNFEETLVLQIPIIIGTIPFISKRRIPTKGEENDETTSVDISQRNVQKYVLEENEIFRVNSIREVNDSENTIYYPEMFTPCYPMYA